MSRSDSLRLGAALSTVAAGTVAIVIAVLLVAHTPGPAPAPSSTPAAATAAAPSTPRAPAGFPAPPAGAVVFSREDGRDALALAVVPRTPGLLVQASVLGPDGRGVSGLRVSMVVHGAPRRGTPCGPGCYRASFADERRPAVVGVEILNGPAATRWRIKLPANWPAADASRLMARATTAWRSLRTLSYRERLSAGPGQLVTSRWQIVAPDRVAYTVDGGYDGVSIGGRRWTRAPGGAWTEGPPEPPLAQPRPFWAAVADARLVGSGRLAGRPVWYVSFFDPLTPAWFRVALDRATARTVDLRMIGAAHFMHDTYGSFDAPTGISPP